MNESIGQAVFVIKINDSDAIKQLASWQSNLSNTMEEGVESTETLSDSFDDLKNSIANLATAGAAFFGLKSGISEVVDSYNQYQAAMNGVKAVAQATGNDVAASLSAVKEVTAGGLITQADAAASIKNLQLYGYSVQEATEMIRVMTDAAVYNRQANYTVSESVRATTEGIRMENSTLSDASGITKNIAKMQEEYAAQLGKSTSNLTDAEKAQAVYNGVLAEGGVFAGNAEEYSNTLAGSQQKLDTAIQGVTQNLGGMFSMFAPVIGGLADWISENEELVAGIATFIALLAGGAGLIAVGKLAVTAIGAMNASLTALVGTSLIAKLAVLGVVGAIVALAAGTLVAAGSSALEETADSTDDLAQNSNSAANEINALGNSADSTAQKIAKLEKSIEKLDRDYATNLKKIAVSHEENLKTLTEQIEEANVDYRKAIDERMADFNVTLAKQERSHQETVDELMTQLNFLQRYNNQYNKEKLAQVEAALAIEQKLYEDETAALQEEMELQNAADKEKLDAKLAALQEELNDEKAFMEKHREDLNSVRDLILDDEIESLKRQYEEQRASYQEQIEEARISGDQIGSGLGQSIEDALKEYDLSSVGKEWADQMINGIFDRLKQGWEQVDQWVQDNIAGKIPGFDKGTKTGNFWEDTRKALLGFSDGGYTGRGGVNEVAGVVHKGEYVVPAEDVDQDTGKPNLGTTQNIVINLSGVLATSAQAKRELAQELQRAIAQTNQSRLA